MTNGHEEIIELHSDIIETPLIFRPMTEADIDQVFELEQQCFPTPWPRKSFEIELQNAFSFCYTLSDGAKIVAYLIYWQVVDEIHIANIAVVDTLRGKGIATWMMKQVLQKARKNGCQVSYLEVRRSNAAAIHIYKKLGFEIVGVRKNYYSEQNEDALLMSCPLRQLNYEMESL